MQLRCQRQHRGQPIHQSQPGRRCQLKFITIRRPFSLRRERSRVNMPNFTIGFPAMGSHIQAWVNVETESQAGILAQVPLWFEAWEARFSRFRPTSELSRLNTDAGAWVTVSSEMAEVIGLALKAAAVTNGLFNPLVLPALQSAGYERSFLEPDFAPGLGLSGVIEVPDWRTIELDIRRQQVRLPMYARLDLGGIVK